MNAEAQKAVDTDKNVRGAHLQCFWHGGALSPFERMCIKSFLAHGHSVEVFSYDSNLNVPEGCRLSDANEILGEDQVFAHRTGPVKGSLGAFSDLFRYALLDRNGGWWVDLDVVCLSDRLPAGDHVFGYQNPGGRVSSAVLKVPAGSPFVRYCHETAARVGRRAVWGQIGPRLVTEAVEKLDLSAHVQPAENFFPHFWDEAMAALDPGETVALLAKQEGSSLVHLWNEIFRQNGVDKAAEPPAGSLIAHYMSRFGN